MSAAAISLRTLPSAAPYMTAFGVILGTALAARYGGWYIWFPFWILISFFDVFAGRDLHSRDPKTPDRDVFWHCALTWLWVPCLFALYIFVFYQIFVSGHLTWSETVGVSAALGQAVSISIAVGHDLAHRRRAWERWLSELLMSLAGLGYYTTEHVYIHHTHVATPYDPVTARKGETIYRFFARSWTGAIASSWRRDRERLARRGRAMWHFSNPWWRYVGVLCCWIVLAAAVGGVAGVAVFLGAAALANLSLRGIDYIEHYGLLRRYVGKGRFEPTRPRHSWNSSLLVSSWALFNVQRHSDHHYKPARRYPLLQHYDEKTAPQLPFNYMVMYLCALVPPLYKKLMNPRIEQWRRHFYPEAEDWQAYDSPLYFRSPHKIRTIAEVMAKDSRLSEWMHRHPMVIEGRHTPEQEQLSLVDEDFDEETMALAQRGLVTLFYRKELTFEELEAELEQLTAPARDALDAVDMLRPWLEDRSFQIALHELREHLTPGDARVAFSNTIEAMLRHLAGKLDEEMAGEFDTADSQYSPVLVVLGSLARSEMTLGDELELGVEPGGAADSPYGENYRRDWTGRMVKALRRLLPSDYPCTFRTLAENLSASETARPVAGAAADR